MTDGKVRLQKYLSECGVASRRKSEELIEQGAVRVNGQVASIGDKINPKSDTVTSLQIHRFHFLLVAQVSYFDRINPRA